MKKTNPDTTGNWLPYRMALDYKHRLGLRPSQIQLPNAGTSAYLDTSLDHPPDP